MATLPVSLSSSRRSVVLVSVALPLAALPARTVAQLQVVHWAEYRALYPPSLVALKARILETQSTCTVTFRLYV
jgi:hypothetical protein